VVAPVTASESSAARLAALKAEYPPAEGPAANIDPELWVTWQYHKRMIQAAEEHARATEIEIREAAGTATRLKVNGTIVARRVITRHEGVSWVQDSYRRTGKDTDNA
jgi:hypothetical protein